MTTQLPLGCLIVVLGGLAATGCIASPDDEVGWSNEPTTHTQALTNNALTNNALTNNALTNNALTNNALTNNALEDPNARELLTYIVSCALPEEETLTYVADDGTVYDFDGALGLAPEWGRPHGRCNETCQQWVSACVLARLDYLGQHVSISIRGQDDALATTAEERAAYTHREATYYGNIFSQPQRFLGCLSPGETGDPRVCGPSLDDCVIEFTGTCDDVCNRPRWDGAFPNCHGPADHGHGHGHHGNMGYVGAITVFLKP
jgi:hypothetical protein